MLKGSLAPFSQRLTDEKPMFGLLASIDCVMPNSLRMALKISPIVIARPLHSADAAGAIWFVDRFFAAEGLDSHQRGPSMILQFVIDCLMESQFGRFRLS
jgi:hypothetical protein